MEKIWLKHYPPNVPTEIDPFKYASLLDMFKESCNKYADRIAYSNMGSDLTYAELDSKTRDLAAYFQNTLGLQKGERLAIMLPNILQYPLVMFAAFRAGLVVVNLNPLYTANEVEHQLKDTGATTIVVLSNFASTVQEALPNTPLKHVIVTEIGDLFSFPKSLLTNFVVRYIKKLGSACSISKALKLTTILKQGAKQTYQEINLLPTDIAYLQATGGTTGLPKSAVLTHHNMVANVEQMGAWASSLSDREIMVTPLPLYHIFSLCVNCLLIFKLGGRNILISNPRDVPGMIKELRTIPFTSMTAVNTLFNALVNNDAFKTLDFSKLTTVVAGGMALQKVVAEKWFAITGNYICEGYGLTEASPVVAANPLPLKAYSHGIGLALPSTVFDIRDEKNQSVGINESGELCVQGPQVMQGYWQNPEETAEVMTADGFLRTGDIAIIDDEGYCHIVDRTKNMISVSGFKVYPNQVEDVIASMPGVLEVAVIGVPNAEGQETVKAFVVRKDPTLTAEGIIAFCHENLTHYKVPKLIEFREELPKSNVGKILHRVLKDEEKVK
jgi:long-chain acyl-CoA synthetase